jgi:hypothetical protein
MTAGRRRRIDQIPEGTAAIVGVNIRTLRQRKGWTQAELGELMGWPTASTVCAAEGHRNGRQRGFTTGGSPATGRHLRHHTPAAHSTVRELQRPPTERVLMPCMRSHAAQTYTVKTFITSSP